MTFDELKDKVLTLPLVPGVYIMRDKNDKVIYVGKAKKLKNRVSQYFQDTASHSPKYNILLKDDKGYPYLRLDMKEIYPVITLAPRLSRDGAEYFGPFGSRHVTNQLLTALREVLKLPDCSRQFPRDVGKERPCLNYHMNRCEGCS